MTNFAMIPVNGRYYSETHGSGECPHAYLAKKITSAGSVIQLHVPAAEITLELTPYRMANLVIELASLFDDDDLNFNKKIFPA